MENQYNLPEKTTPKQSLFIWVSAVVVLLVVVFFIALSIGLKLGASKNQKEAGNQPANKNGVDQAIENVVIPGNNNGDSNAMGHDASGNESEATLDERKSLGVLDFQKIKVIRRNDQGKILSYTIELDSKDSDNDGIPDEKELEYGTDPNKVDTDGDGISDYQELTMKTDPKVKNDFEIKK